VHEHREETAPDSPRPRRLPSWVTRNLLLLGTVSLLTDVSTEMVIPLLPYFLTTTLGASAMALGWIEGLAEATASVLKLFSGRWADRMGRHRPLVLAGYLLSSVTRPLLGATQAVWQVLGVRLLDRTGKGLRTSPRDSLIAASVDAPFRSSAFGLHRSMDHVGAVLGPLVAAGFLAFLSTDLRLLFWLTAIPGAAAVAVLWLGVKESPAGRAQAGTPKEVGDLAPVRRGDLARFLVPLGLFTLGNASDVFLLLKAGGTRAPLYTLPLLWIGLHVVKAATSIPGGRLADRVGRRRVIAAGWFFYSVVYVGFAFVESQLAIWTLFVAYGLYHGLTEGAERALIAELAPRHRRGGAYGWYHLTLGTLALAASVLFGTLWDLAGSRAAFLTSAGIALLAVVLLGMATRGSGRRIPTAPGS
jgi:MFS family permease